MENEAPKPRKNPLQDYAKYSGLGLQMLLIILIGAYSGEKTDEFLKIPHHILTITFSLIAVAASLWMVVKKIS